MPERAWHGDGDTGGKAGTTACASRAGALLRGLLGPEKGIQCHRQGKMPLDSGGIRHGVEHGLTDPQLLVGRDHGLPRVGELRGIVSCWPRRDPGGPTIRQAVQHLGGRCSQGVALPTP